MTDEVSTSHQLADNLIALAEWLKTRPVFEIPAHEAEVEVRIMHFYSDRPKELVPAAVKACGSGAKGEGITHDYFAFYPDTVPPHTKLSIECFRDAICRIIKPAQPAVYECDPLIAESESSNV